MAFTETDAKALFSGLRSLLLRLGEFDRVGLHEPENPPGKGLNVSLTLGQIRTAPSGLASTSLEITFLARIYKPLETRPLDSVDPALLAATCALMGAWSAEFTLHEFTTAGLVRNLDLMAATADPKYLIQDGKGFRVMEVTMPLTINDAFDQGA